jgi:hypothetical protein
MNAAPICSTRHQTTERIDFSYQVAFADAPNRGIAAHLAQCLDILSQQQSARARTSRCHRGFSSRMTTANHNYVKFSRKLHYLSVLYWRQ